MVNPSLIPTVPFTTRTKDFVPVTLRLCAARLLGASPSCVVKSVERIARVR